MCLAKVVDLPSRELIGYAIALYMRARLAVDAISAVHRAELVAGNASMHTGRGSAISCEGIPQRAMALGHPAEH